MNNEISDKEFIEWLQNADKEEINKCFEDAMDYVDDNYINWSEEEKEEINKLEEEK